MEPISIDPTLGFIALYDKTKKLLTIMDMMNNSTVATYDSLELNTSVNVDQCWTYHHSRKRSNTDNKNVSFDVLTPEKKTNASGEYFICCNAKNTGFTKNPSVHLNNLKKKQTCLMEMSHQKKPSTSLSINTLVAHPFDHLLFTGCNDGSIVRWYFGEKQSTKMDYTCSSRIIAMALKYDSNTLVFMEEKSSTIHVVSIEKSLKSLYVLKNEINISHVSMKIVNNGLFGCCGNNSFVSLYKSDISESNKNYNFDKFQTIQLKNNVSDFDIVEYNKLYYLAALNRKRTSLSVFPLQNVYNTNSNTTTENTPLYSINVTSGNQLVHIIKIKLVAQTSKNISPICLLYYTLTPENQTKNPTPSMPYVKISIIYLGDLNLGVNNVEISNQELDKDTLETVINHMAFNLEEQQANKLKINELDETTNQPLPTTKTLVQTLTQVINSNDNRLLEDIINRTSIPVIDNSIPLLPSPLAYRLLSLLTDKIESNPSKSSELSYWIKSILSHHVSFFSTIMSGGNNGNSPINPLQKLQNILEFRTHFYGQLCEIKGRVSVLMNHIKREKTFDKQSLLDYNLVKPTIKIDENSLEAEKALTENLMEYESTDYSSELSDVDMVEMESLDES